MNIQSIFADSANLVSDIVRFGDLKDGLSALAQSIVDRVNSEISASGVSRREALADLRDHVKSAIREERPEKPESYAVKRASELLLSLGLRERAASDKGKEKSEERAARLAPLVEKLVAIAKTEAADAGDAVSALRRAYLTVQGELKA